MDVKAFKLRTGEEIVAELTGTGKVGKKVRYSIENPIAPSPNGLSAWFAFSATRVFELFDSDLLFPPTEPHDEILDLYTKEFGTIIAPPANKVIAIK